jgi:hypothetical protein
VRKISFSSGCRNLLLIFINVIINFKIIIVLARRSVASSGIVPPVYSPVSLSDNYSEIVIYRYY